MYLLTPNHYARVLPLVLAVPFNTGFARSVLRHHIRGDVYVDDPEQPHNAWIAHPYGMVLLVGDGLNEPFNRWINAQLVRDDDGLATQWLQAYPQHWHARLGRLLCQRRETPLRVAHCSRVNFRFNASNFNTDDIDVDGIDESAMQIQPLTEDQFLSFGTGVRPAGFWNHYRDLMARGHAYTVMVHDVTACTAFAAFVEDDTLEIGIETDVRFRQQGLAYHACQALIQDCLERHLTPVWSCRFENQASYRLAIRLGFEESGRYPYYGIRSPS